MEIEGASANAEERVRVDFTLGIGKGRLDASVEVPAGNATLTQIMPALQTLSSDIVGAVVELVEAEGRQVSCRQGCAACCRQMVPLSLFEAEALAEWIAGLPEDQQEMLRQRFDAALRALSAKSLLEAMDPARMRAGSEELLRLGHDYLHAWVDCPFLVNESCAIHPIRPTICREYLVTSPAEFCFDPALEGLEGVHMPLKLSQGLIQIGAQVEQGGGWLPLVFLMAWMKSGSKPGRYVQGPGPQVVYAVLQSLEPAAAAL